MTGYINMELDKTMRLDEWINKTDPEYQPIRIAMYMVLYAFASNELLSKNIVFKGGGLLSLNYGSDRHTTDIDFSLISKDGFNREELKEEIEKSLIKANVLFIQKGVKCRLQGIKFRPKGETDEQFLSYRFPSIVITIGFAKISDVNQIKKLDEGMAANTISIDLSLNEVLGDLSEMTISTMNNVEEIIKVYSFHTLVAEKFRSILQQVERNRSRRQDIYDLNLLISKYADHSTEEKHKVLVTLLKISKNKNIDNWLNKEGMDDQDIESRSKSDNKALGLEIEQQFNTDEAYEYVRQYFKSMPWDLYGDQ